MVPEGGVRAGVTVERVRPVGHGPQRRALLSGAPAVCGGSVGSVALSRPGGSCSQVRAG